MFTGGFEKTAVSEKLYWRALRNRFKKRIKDLKNMEGPKKEKEDFYENLYRGKTQVDQTARDIHTWKSKEKLLDVKNPLSGSQLLKIRKNLKIRQDAENKASRFGNLILEKDRQKIENQKDRDGIEHRKKYRAEIRARIIGKPEK